MRPGTRDGAITVEEAIQIAARATDPDKTSEGVTALVLAFEGDDRPSTAPADLTEELRSAAREIDPEGSDPDVARTAAAANWLATNPGDAKDPERVIREGSRLFGIEP
jgi:hypothetical protein